MKGKKFLGILLTGTICMAMLAGCGKATDSEVAQKEVSVENFNGSSWKRDNSPITVDWFVAYDWYGKVFDPVNNLADKALLEETGISLNFITGDYDKLNALIISGELPDIVTFDASASQRLQMEDNGMVRDLASLEENYAPDLNVPQSQKDWYRNEDGNWYSLISYYCGPERCNKEFGGSYGTHNSNFVRKDLLDQIGMSIEDLKTPEGAIEVLKKVRDSKLQYDGMDVIPYAGVNIDYMVEQMGIYQEDSKGNLASYYEQPEYLDALLFYNTLYREGLITKDEFTQDATQRDQKIASGQVFMSTSWMTVKQPRSALYANDSNAQMLYCGNMEPEGKETYYGGVNCAGWTTTMITQKAENPERIISLFSYLTQESVTLDEELGYGCYDIVDGKAIRSEEKQKEYDQDYTAAYNKYNMNMQFAVDYTINQKYENTNIDNLLEQDRIKSERDADKIIYDNKCFTGLSPIAGTDLSAVEASINEYWNAAYPQMIMASSAEECEKLWKEGVEQIKILGYDNLQEYKNQKFHENKAKIGLEFAFPAFQ